MDKLASSKIFFTFWPMNLFTNTSLPLIANALKVGALLEVKPIILTVLLKIFCISNSSCYAAIQNKRTTYSSI